MAVILETKATKDEILELYLNDVYLGNRGSFALHGVAEAARIFFGKDVSNLSLSEAALIAGVIQNPYQHSPFVNRERSKERRNLVLSAMAEADFITRDAADRAAADPVTVVAQRRRQRSAVLRRLSQRAAAGRSAGRHAAQTGALDVYTTLDLNLQRYAQEAVRDGLAKVDQTLARRKQKPGPAQAALVAVDPRTGEVLALVGGRFYNQSQFNRATTARRQPGSTFKPFVYLAAFERAADEGPRRSHAGHDGVGRADDLDLRRAGMVAAQLRERIRRLSSRCVGRWRCRATSRRSRWPSRPASITSQRCGRRPTSARPRFRAIPRSRSACSS